MAGLRIRWRRVSESVFAAPGAASLTAARGSALVWTAAGIVVLLALIARSYNTNWDDSTHLHPDERHMTGVATNIDLPSDPFEYFDTARSPLNPYNPPSNTGSFVYGTLPLFLTKLVAVVLAQDDFDHVVLAGRHLTALFDTLTVLLVFLIGRRLYSATAGLLGAVLFAAAPLAIQHSHFFIVDSYLTAFTTASLYFSVRVFQDRKPSDAALAGAMLGLGMACKITAVLAAPVVVAAVAWQVVPHASDFLQTRRLDEDARQALRNASLGLALAVVMAFLTFRAGQPYAFETPSLSNTAPWALNQRWLDDQKSQAKLLSGDVSFPPSVQWIGRSSYLYPLEQMTLWGAGPALSLAGWLAAGYAAFRLLRRNDLRHLLPLLFLLAYFGFMGRQFSLYLRYFLPIYPVLALMAGYGLVELVAGARRLSERMGEPRFLQAGYAVAGVVVALGVLAGPAYMSVYTRPVTRIQASRWMYENLPAGSEIAVEHWDETVPFQVAGTRPRDFRLLELKLYDLDSREKVAEMIDVLSRANYIAISSNRLVNSIPRNPVNYPVTSRYYDLLFDGELGFRLLREFTSYPRLLGIEMPDYKAQESQSSYDHPRVLVFEKGSDFSRANLEAKLGQGPFATAGLTPAQADKNGLLLRPDDLATQREGGTWTSVFSDSGIAHSAPTFVWLLAVEAAALAALPIVFLVCRRLPDRGYLLSKPLGLLLVAYPVWLGASLKLFHFDQTSILLSLLALATVSGVIMSKQRQEMSVFLRQNWRLVLVCELLFLAAFFAFRELRMVNPDLWHPFRGGEKPMDLAYLTAVARSTTLPPYDPWFAGGYINYYYFGQFLTATLLKLTAIPPEVGFNLAVPTFFAMTLGGAFSIAYNLAAYVRGAVRRAPRMPAVPRWSPYVAGLLGAVFVAVAGNLDGVDQLLDRLERVSSLHVDTPVPVIDGLINAAGGLWQVVVHGKSLAPFDFWRSSRMMPPTISITEFPYWSFLFADLHAHMIAIPFEVLTIGLCLTLVLSKAGESSDRRDWAGVVLLGLMVGSLRWLNSWDYPPFLLLALTCVAIGERHLDGGPWATAKRLGAKAVVLTVLSFLLFKPFLDAYQTPVSGLHPSEEQTPIHQYLAHFGAFLAPVAAWVVFLTLRAIRSSPLRRGTNAPGQQAWLGAAAVIAFVTGLAMMVLLVRGYALVAVLLPCLVLLLYLATRELRRRRADSGMRLFLLALVALGLGLSMGVDLVTLDGDIIRMNTVFKFYVHIWIAFALVAAFAAWYLVFAVWLPALSTSRGSADGAPTPHPSPLPSRGEGTIVRHQPEWWGMLRILPRVLAISGTVGLGLLLMAVLIYPALGTPARLDDRFAELPATLDGEAYMRTAVYNDEKGAIRLGSDYEGIQWLRQNVKGTPAIVEGRTPLYHWGGRFSIYTGLPTMLGWDWHQTQQRGKLAFMVDQRGAAVDAFYANNDIEAARRFLRQYGIEYVIVGQVERMYYPASGIAKFDGRLGGALDLVFENPDLRIYHVNQETLRALIGTQPVTAIQPPP